jgi:hypothetical protein
MFKEPQNIFFFVISYFGFDNQPKHVTIYIFEIPKVIGQTLTNNLKSSFYQYELKRNIIVYVKDERSNLNIAIIAMKCIVKYEALGLNENFHGICLNHCFFP